MAYVKGKSGYFDIPGNYGFAMRVKWSETYDLDKNTSILSVDGIQFQSAYYSGKYYPGGTAPDYGTVKVDGTLLRTLNYMSPATHSVDVVYGTSWWDLVAINLGYHDDNKFPWQTAEIQHNADGKKSVTVSVYIKLWRENAGHSPTFDGSATIDLTEIPRASTATVPDFTMGTKGTISISRASSAFTHTLSVKLGGKTYQLATGVSTSYAWTPAISTWAPRITDAASASCTMVIDTYNGSTKLGSMEYAFTLSVPASVVPSISAFSVELVNDNAAVNGWGIAVKTLTKLAWSITAAGVNGSTIKSYAFTAGSLKGSGASGTTSALASAGNVTFSASVTDSRGRTATATGETITVYDYSAPTISRAEIYRCLEDGTEDNSGSHLKLNITGKIASVNGKNTATYQYRSMIVNGSFGSWTAFEPGAVVPGFSSDTSYVVEMRVVDAPGKSASTSITIPTREEWLHGKDGGKGAAFGKVAEEDNLLDVAWDLRVRGNLILDNPLEGATGVTEVTEAGTDLNDYTKPGWYSFESNRTPINIPIGSNGWLHVFDSRYFVKQIWYRSGTPGTNDHHTFVRTKKIGSEWGAWKQYYATNISDLVAMNLNDIADTAFYVNEGDDLDNYLTPGAYRIATAEVAASITNSPPYSSAGGRLIVSATSSSGGKIQVIIYNSVYGQIWYRIRSNSGTWGDWLSLPIRATSYAGCKYTISSDGYNEWINPPMVLGTEYRTTERWNNKVVFTKIANCGKMTNGGTYTYSSETVYPVRFAGYCNGHALPVLLSDAYSGTWKMWVYVKNSVITAFFGSSWSNPNIFVQVWYVKE